MKTIKKNPVAGPMKRIKELDDQRNGWYEITPRDAGALLESQPPNRPLSEARASFYADQIKEGDFVPNGESIVLDADGNVRDGQHRLRAVEVAGKPIRSFVVFMPKKLDEKAWQDSMDKGKIRTTADSLSMNGIPNYTLAAMVARLIALHDAGQIGSLGSGAARAKLSVHTIHKIFDGRQGEIESAIEDVQAYRKRLSKWLPMGYVVFAYLVARSLDQKKASEWLRAVCTGENLDEENPVYKLREMLMDDALGKNTPRKLTLVHKLALLIRSWSYFRYDYRPRLLMWRGGGDEPFPTFDADVSNALAAKQRRGA